MEYFVYTPAEQLTVATDFLRSAEAAHYRLKLLPDADPTRDERLKAAEAEVVERQKEYKRLKDAVDSEE